MHSSEPFTCVPSSQFKAMEQRIAELERTLAGREQQLADHVGWLSECERHANLLDKLLAQRERELAECRRWAAAWKALAKLWRKGHQCLTQRVDEHWDRWPDIEAELKAAGAAEERELDECHKKLAAAEARELVIIDKLERVYAEAHKCGEGAPILDLADDALFTAQTIEARQALDAALEQAAGGPVARAVVHCADLHATFDASLDELVDEMQELIDALNGEHEHTPQNELVQIGAYAINCLRQMGSIPSLKWIEQEAKRHEQER